MCTAAPIYICPLLTVLIFISPAFSLVSADAKEKPRNYATPKFSQNYGYDALRGYLSYFNTKEVHENEPPEWVTSLVSRKFAGAFQTSPANCFFVIQNYGNVHFHLANHPVLLRRHNLSLIRTLAYRRKTRQRVRTGWERNWTKVDIYNTIPDRPYIIDFSRYKWKWTNKDTLKFHGYSKPWNCHVDVILFPPMRVMEKIFSWYETDLILKLTNPLEMHPLPSSIPILHVLVTYNKTFDQLSTGGISEWVCEPIMVTPLHNSVYLHMNIAVNKTNSIRINQILIHDLKIIHEPIPFGKLASFHLLSTKTISSIKSAPPPIHFIKSKINSYHVWMTIIANSSFRYTHSSGSLVGCPRLNLFVAPEYLSAQVKLLGPSYFEDFQITMRFVTCVPKDTANLPFSQLFEIFQLSIWTSIGASIIALSLSFSVLERNFQLFKISLERTLDHLFSAVKVLVEQEYPFPTKVTGITRLRVLIGAYLLMGVVLSNAYKNTNVLTLISPRSLIPFRRYSELMQKSDMTAFTRYGDLIIRQLTNFLKMAKPHAYLHAPEQLRYSSTTVSELGFLAYGISHLYHTEEKNEIEQLVWNASSVFRFMDTAMYDTIRNLVISKKYNATDPFSDSDLDDIAQSLIERENNAVLLELSKCRNSAFVVKENECYMLAKRLIQANSSRIISVGEEAYFKRNLVFHLSGLISPAIMRRLRSIETAGIWNHVAQNGSATFNLTRIQTTVPFNRTSLNGNVLVIFLLLILGLAMSFFGFIVEIRMMVYRGVKNTAKKFKAMWRKLYLILLLSVQTKLKLKFISKLHARSAQFSGA